MVRLITPSGDKSPTHNLPEQNVVFAPSAPDLSPSHQHQPYGAFYVEFSGEERVTIDANVLRLQHFANFLRQTQFNIVNNVLKLENVKKAGFDLYVSYLEYDSIKFCNLEDALLCLETSRLMNCVGLCRKAVENIDLYLGESNVLRVLKTIALMQRQGRNLNLDTSSQEEISRLCAALRSNCTDVSKSCSKEIVLSDEFLKLPPEDALAIFRLLDLSLIRDRRVIITEGEFLLGPAKKLPENECNFLHKLIKGSKSKVKHEFKNHVYHLSARTLNGCPVCCDPQQCDRIRCQTPDKNKKESKNVIKEHSQKFGYGLCRCWQMIFD